MEKIKEMQRKYNCPQCGKRLIEGREFQFPPRLSYWYCPKCQHIFGETEDRNVVAYAPVKGNENRCVQNDNIRGCVENLNTKERTYADNLA